MYPTADGTCVRDYIHVNDLGRAHLAALESLGEGKAIKVNLGTGVGHSVKQDVDACREVSGRDIPIKMGERREGDPPELVADPSRASEELGWKAEYTDFKKVVASAWEWHRTHPNGYDD